MNEERLIDVLVRIAVALEADVALRQQTVTRTARLQTILETVVATQYGRFWDERDGEQGEPH